MPTVVYVDGFNLYYGALRGTPYRWLNLDALCTCLLPGHAVSQIKYYTARVRGLPHDPDKPRRQLAYLRALRTLPNVSIHFGHFLSHATYLPLASGDGNSPQYRPDGSLDCVRVIRTEEKGSDVNLATHLLRDGFANLYDVAVVVSNDSDLVEPIRVVRADLGKKVGIINPHSHPSADLAANQDFMKQIRAGVLGASLFTPTLADASGTFNKPPSW